MQPGFPFTAVVGQDQIKTALLLVCVDPGIGGLLISGPRGSAKSTLVRGLADLGTDLPLVTLPLGASEEMVSGTLDIGKALKDSEVAFRPGLIARAHTGILYVDEVNLLADHLVDLLLDAASSGFNTVERDGISHQHECRFALVGTMNPDEGELRPQLMDRFGLMALVQTDFTLEQRKRIALERLEFDSDPILFRESHRENLAALAADIESAAKLLGHVETPADIADDIANRCHAAGVEGLRADITMHRAARAWAAFRQRKHVVIDDIEMVAPLVLNHRSEDPGQPGPAPESGSGDPGGQSGDSGGNTQGSSSIQGTWGAFGKLVRTGQEHHEFSFTNVKRTIPKGHFSSIRGSVEKGDLAESARLSAARSASGKKVNWHRTLSIPGFRQMDAQSRTFRVVFQSKLPGSVELDLVLLDASASTLSGNGLQSAKGIVASLSREAYRNRRHLGIVTFGGDRVTTLLHPQRAPKNAGYRLDTLEAGGGTPWREALDHAGHILKQPRTLAYRSHVYIITDGRFEATQLSHPVLIDYPVTMVDIESGRVRLGMAKQIAERIGAGYISPANSQLAGTLK